MPYPKSIQLEAAAICQLKCPACSTTSGSNIKAIGRGYLKSADFLSFIERHPLIRNIELSCHGEVFLNPQLPAILEIAFKHNVALYISNGSNFNTVSDEAIDAIIRYKLRFLSISIDGASEETYTKYRVGGSYERVIVNIERLVAAKRQMGSSYPALAWQFVVFGHNEHEISRARQVAESFGMRFNPKQSWDEKISPLQDTEVVKKNTGWNHASRSEFQATEQKPYRAYATCNQLWDQPQINWNGQLLGCCTNRWFDFGANVFKDGLEAAYHSEKISYARKMVVGEAEPRADIPCTQCPKYHFMRAKKSFIEKREWKDRHVLSNIGGQPESSATVT